MRRCPVAPDRPLVRERGCRPTPAVLMVDDDVELCALVSEYLGGHGYDVSAVHDGRAACAGARRAPDLLILDVMLPVLDGFEVLRQLRKRSDVPVIMLTARAEEQDRVAGLRRRRRRLPGQAVCGAAELLGRVRAVLRRTTARLRGASRVSELGALTLDAQARRHSGRAFPCSHANRIRDPGRVDAGGGAGRFTRRAVSGRSTSAKRRPMSVLDVHVSHLRKKLDARRRARSSGPFAAWAISARLTPEA